MSGTSSTYLYDGDGKRASKTVGGTPTNYTYDVNASLPVLLDDGTRKYVWGLGLAFAADASGSPIVYHTDGLGSVRALTDVSGTVVQTYLYDEYGNVLSSSGSITQPFQYTEEQRDETGLVYLRARMYDPGAGRFAERDPRAGTTLSPLSMNRYSYVACNPLNRIDPSGLFCVGVTGGTTGSIGSIVGGGGFTGNLGAGACLDNERGFSLGGYVSVGWFSGSPFDPNELSYPAGSGDTAFGGFIGGGGGLFATNARSMDELSKTQETASIDASLAWIPVKGSLQRSWGDGIWIDSATVGVGQGFGVTKLRTQTWTASSWRDSTPVPSGSENRGKSAVLR